MRTIFAILMLLSPVATRAAPRVVPEWLVLGTIGFEREADPFDERVPSELRRAAPDVRDTFEDRSWTSAEATADGLVDLVDRGFEPEEMASAFLHVYVFSPDERTATLAVGSDDGIQAFVNGTEVHRNWVLRGWRADQDRFPVRLGAGWNRLLLRVANLTGGFGASAQFIEGDGLRISATRPADYRAVRVEPLLDLAGVRPRPRLTPGEGATLQLTLLANVRNLGTEIAEDVALRVSIADGRPDVVRAFSVRPGNEELELHLDAERVARAVASGATLELHLEYERIIAVTSVSVPAGPRPILRIVVSDPPLRDAPPVAAEHIELLLDGWKWGALFRPDLYDDEAAFRELLRAYVDGDARTFGRQWGNLRHTLKRGAETIRTQRITFVGNSHIDMAWLWDRAETKRVVEMTYDQALEFIDEFESFRYAQSQVQTFEWVAALFPEMMQRMDEAVAAGRWIPVGGMWVEPDCNLPSGESFVRQLLYGKGWVRDRWGIDVKIGWNPDSFGYAWTLPMIFKGAGIDYFITQKIGWNDTTEFPHRLFWWEAPDGSRVLSYFPFTYVDDAQPDVLAERLQRQQEQQPGLEDMLNLYGVGDHGGGPTREMIERYVEMSRLETFPVVEHAHPVEFMQRVEGKYSGRIPVWDDELYLEYHRGTFTTQAEVKRRNRRMESSLETAEKFATLAAALDPGFDYPVDELDGAWLRTLFNQFHDILPGSSIPEVYVDAHADYDEAERLVDRAQQTALDALVESISTDDRSGTPVVVFNSLSWSRSGVVCVPRDQLDDREGPWRVVDSRGKSGPVQAVGQQACFVAGDVSGIGYRTFWITASGKRSRGGPIAERRDDHYRLRNERVEVLIDARTGNLSSLVSQPSNHEVLRQPGGGNVLQLLGDVPAEWDAWNIGYTGERWSSEPARVEIVESGPVRAVVRVSRNIGASEVVHDHVVEAGSPLVEVRTLVNWTEEHKFLKTAFHLAADAETATFEIPYGTIERTTRPRTEAERAKWEVPGQRWVDVTDRSGRFGLTLVNDSKYGYDVEGTTLRLSLLRAPKYPDPRADIGEHRFSYGLYPHDGDWRAAKSYRRGAEFNLPLIPVVATGGASGPLASERGLVVIDGDHVLISAMKAPRKPAARPALVVRLAEVEGRNGTVALRFPFEIASASLVDLMEDREGALRFQANTAFVTIAAHGLTSVLVEVDAGDP